MLALNNLARSLILVLSIGISSLSLGEVDLTTEGATPTKNEAKVLELVQRALAENPEATSLVVWDHLDKSLRDDGFSPLLPKLFIENPNFRPYSVEAGESGVSAEVANLRYLSIQEFFGFKIGEDEPQVFVTLFSKGRFVITRTYGRLTKINKDAIDSDQLYKSITVRIFGEFELTTTLRKNIPFDSLHFKTIDRIQIDEKNGRLNLQGVSSTGG